MSGLFGQMGFRSAMGSGTNMAPMNTGMSMPFVSARPPSGGMGGGHGGRFTGDFMATRGAANGRPIFEGTRGGLYHVTKSGNRSYLPK
jgi:hypothetical protein